MLEHGLPDPAEVHGPDAQAEEGMSELPLDDEQERERRDHGENDVDDVEDDQEAGLPDRRPDPVEDGLDDAHGSLLSSTIRRSGGQSAR
jgi:hypothetical protein